MIKQQVRNLFYPFAGGKSSIKPCKHANDRSADKLFNGFASRRVVICGIILAGFT